MVTKKKPGTGNSADDLWARAEKLLAAKGAALEKMPLQDVQTLVHELQVHQIELEMQNEELRRSYQQIEESRSRYLDLFDFAPLGYFTLDEKGLIVEINFTGSRMVGQERHRLLKTPFFLLVAPADRAVFQSHRKDVFSSSTKQTCELRLQAKDGPPLYVVLESVAVPGEVEPGLHCRTAISDINARKKAEESLRKSEEKYRDIFNNAQAGVYRTRISNGKMLEANPRLAQLFGYQDREEFISEFLAPAHYVDPGARERMLAALQEEGELHNYEVRFSRKDGSIFWLLFSTRIYSEDGFLEGVAIDITDRKQAEEALRETRNYLENLLDYANAPIIVWDTESMITRFNHAFENLTGYAAQEVIGKKLFVLFPEATRNKSLSKIIRTLSGELWQSVEIPILRKDGEVRVALWNSANIYAADGTTLVATIAQGQDITERRRAEEEIREQRQILEFILEKTLAGYWYRDLKDGTGYFSPTFKKMFGYEDHELPNEPLFWQKLIFPEDLSGVLEVLRQHIESHGKVPFYNEVRYRHKNGSTVWVICTGQVIEWDEQGQPVRLVGCHVNITDRKQAEEALRETRNYLENLLDYANAPIIVWDPEFRITRFNHAFENLTGYSANEVIGQKLEMLFPEASREKSLRNIARTSSGERWQSVEIPILRKDGEVRIALWNSANIYAADGTTLVATIAQGQDITERKRTEKALQVSHHFLEIANRHSEMAPLLEEFVEEIQKTTQCQAVAIRVLDAQANIPYQAYRGFSREFYELESPLSIKRDECMCINVIKGTTDPQLPFYTPGGSFYMNATTHFLATVSEEEKGRTRNACNQFGYESVALLPTLMGDHILGLIHVADPKENMVPLQRVEQLEGIAKQLGAAMQRVSSKASLDNFHRQYELILNSAWEGIVGLNLNGNHTFVNPAAARMLGYEVEELIGRHSHSTWHHTRANGSPYPAEECPIYEAFRKGSTQHVTDEYFIKKDGTSFVVEAISTPIKENGDISGTVVTFWDITQRKQTEEALKESLARTTEVQDGTIQALATVTETRDPYTAGHQRLVTRLACAIARELGLPADQVAGLRVMGLLHDLGKISIPAEILSKPGKLSEIEFEIIKSHAQAGYEIVKEIRFPWPVAEVILQHHERMDGSGYPQGLTGPDITLEARILAVADVVEAMASHRPYRPALGIDKALEEISRNRGVLYDPEVVDTCIKVCTEKGFKFE